MQTLFNIIMLLCIIIIPALHILCAVFKSKSTPISLLCLAAHAVASLPLLYFGAQLRLVLMLYMISLALRQLAFFVFDRVSLNIRKRGDGDVL